MAPKYTDEHFLVLCMKNLKTQKLDVDFKKVGEACGITPHSAYCRLNTLQKRWAKENGNDDNANGSNDNTPKSTKSTSKSTPKRGAKTKKNAYRDEDSDDSDDSDESPSKKRKLASKSEGNKVKPEPKEDTVNDSGIDFDNSKSPINDPHFDLENEIAEL